MTNKNNGKTEKNKPVRIETRKTEGGKLTADQYLFYLRQSTPSSWEETANKVNALFGETLSVSAARYRHKKIVEKNQSETYEEPIATADASLLEAMMEGEKGLLGIGKTVEGTTAYREKNGYAHTRDSEKPSVKFFAGNHNYQRRATKY